jgi:hypothetical protein
MKIKTQPIRNYGTQKVSSKRKVYSPECIIKNTERYQISNIILHIKLLEK